jgi:hypothetical protein
MCGAGLRCGLSHKDWAIRDNSSGRSNIPLYHLRTLPPYLTKNASPKTRKIEEVMAGFVLCGSVAMAADPSAHDTDFLGSVKTPSPLRYVLPGLPAFFCHPFAV